MFWMVWRKKDLYEEEKLRKDKIIGDLERVTTLEKISWGEKIKGALVESGKQMYKSFPSCGQFE